MNVSVPRPLHASLLLIGSAVPLWCAPASFANFGRAKRWMEWIKRRLQGRFMIDKRKKNVCDLGVFLLFWINLPRYVAIILYDSIYRIKLPSCELYRFTNLSRSNCGNLRQAKNRKVTICSAVPTTLFSTLTGLSCFIVPHFSFTQNWAWQTWYLIIFLLEIST